MRGNRAFMLRVDDREYAAIDGLYYPNCEEIERCIDWIYANNLHEESIGNTVNAWLHARTHVLMNYCFDEMIDISFEEFVKEIMYADAYTPCQRTMEALRILWQNYEGSEYYVDEAASAEAIEMWVNQNFTRVRFGDEYNPEEDDTLYFRISSKGVNWRPAIQQFLINRYGYYGSPNPPKRIWIGLDMVRDLSVTVLFEGTWEELWDCLEDRSLMWW